MVHSEQMTTYFQTLRLFNRPVRSYLWAETLSGFTVDGGIYAVLFNLYLLRLGYQTPLIGAANAAGLLAFGLCSLPAGMLGRRWGSQWMLVAGLGTMATGCAALPLAELIPAAGQTNWLIASYIVINVGLALYIANASPFVMAVTQPAERNHVFSMASALWFLGGFMGNLAGGWLPALFAVSLGTSLDQPAPYRYGLVFSALLLIPALLAMLSVRQLRVSPTPKPSENRGTIPFARVSWLASARLLQVMGAGSVFLFLSIYLDKGLGAETATIGMLLAISRLGAMLASLLTPLLLARWNNSRLVIGTTAGIAVSLLPLVLMPNLGAAALSSIGVVALTAIRMPAFLIFSMEAVAPEQRATMSGANEMANGLGFAIISLAGGYIISALGYHPLFLMSACLTVIGTLVFWWYSQTHCKPSIDSV